MGSSDSTPENGAVDTQTPKIDALIQDNPVVVFSATYCGFCASAKRLLTTMGAKYTTVECDKVEGGDQLREELKIKTRRSTLPNIFIGGVGIGGYSDGPGIYTLFKQGKLGDMLRKVGAL